MYIYMYTHATEALNSNPQALVEDQGLLQGKTPSEKSSVSSRGRGGRAELIMGSDHVRSD